MRVPFGFPMPPTVRPYHLGLIALGIVAAQVLVACLLSDAPDPHSAWRCLDRWDGGWFRSVLVDGYQSPVEPTHDNPGNTPFLPAYPLLANGVRTVTQLDPQAALLLTAQLAAVGAWWYFLLLLRQAGVGGWTAAVFTFLLAAHPGAFFLIASYSESTFLCGLLGFLYWSNRDGPAGLTLAAGHGFAMTAARLVGLPVVVYPVLRAVLTATPERRWRTVGVAVLVAVVAALGAGGYELFLRLRFGRWDMLTAAQAAGWDLHPDPWAFFRARTWALKYVEILTCWGDGEALSRLSVPITAGHFLLLGIAEVIAARWKKSWAGLRARAPLYLLAFALFAVPVVSHGGARSMSSLFRFAVCWHAVLAVAAAGVSDDGPAWFRSWWVRGVLLAGGAWSASVQAALLARFVRNTFVA